MDFALDIFQFQREHNLVYKQWCELQNPTSIQPKTLSEIPFLPIQFFKTHRVSCMPTEEIVFTSSSTTGTGISQHFVYKKSVYETSFNLGFRHFYGEPSDFEILALLPGYLERTGSSLVYMADKLIEQAAQNSGFYLNQIDELRESLKKQSSKKTLLLGVTFALLDFPEINLNHNSELIVMETGGMKGRGQELTRQELHTNLGRKFQVPQIHSEYGMTELLSQAYSAGNGRFFCPPWMKIVIKDPSDPGCQFPVGKTGRLCIVDLANMYSASFIATDDLGKLHEDGSFEVMGRLDFSDLRGCSQLVL